MDEQTKETSWAKNDPSKLKKSFADIVAKIIGVEKGKRVSDSVNTLLDSEDSAVHGTGMLLLLLVALMIIGVYLSPFIAFLNLLVGNYTATLVWGSISYFVYFKR